VHELLEYLFRGWTARQCFQHFTEPGGHFHPIVLEGELRFVFYRGGGEFKYDLSVLERRRTNIQQRWGIPPSGVPKAIVDEFHRSLIYLSLARCGAYRKIQMLSLIMWFAAPLHMQIGQCRFILIWGRVETPALRWKMLVRYGRKN